MNQWSFAADGGLPHYGAGSYFGQYGGRYVAETLSAPLDELERAIKQCVADKSFRVASRGRGDVFHQRWRGARLSPVASVAPTSFVP